MAQPGADVGQSWGKEGPCSQAGEDIMEREARARAILDTTVDAIITVNERGLIESFNRAAETIFGYRAEEVVGTNVSVLMPEPYHGHHDEYIASYLRTGIAKIIGRGREGEGRRKDGRTFPLEIAISEVVFGDRRIFAGVLRDITRRKLAEELNRRYEFIVNSIMEAISLIDRDYSYREVNSAWCLLHGLGREEAIGKKLSDIWGEDVFQSIIKSRIDACFAGEEVLYASWIGTETGARKYYDIILYPYFDERKSITHVIVVTRDLTAGKGTEEQLRILSQAVEQSPVSVVITDVKGDIEYVNPKFVQTTQYTKEEVLGRNPRILKSGEMPEEGYKRLWDTIMSGKEWRGEFHNRKKSGELYWESASISPVRDQEGVTSHFVAIKEDVTAIKEAREELAKLSLVASKTDNSVIITDRDGCIEWVNEGFTRMAGYTMDEVAGRKPGHVLQGPLTSREAAGEMTRLLGEQKSFTIEITNHHKDGHPYWVSINVTPVLDEKGRLTHFIAIESDITERKRAEAELREAKKVAEDANRAKSDFLASMSHEIRTPMNAIIGITELLAETPLTPDQAKYVNTVKTAGDNLLNIINDILDLSKIETGLVELDSTKFDLQDVMEETCEAMALRAHGKGIELICHLPPGLPVFVVGDPIRLRQILINLIGNAVKFTEAGEVVVEVGVEGEGPHAEASRPPGPEEEVVLLFSIRDTGIGIPPDKIEKVFERFIQADSSTTRKYGGTGLGLPISKRLVELMGGSIWVESKPGEGSTFSFTARLSAADMTKEKAESYDRDMKGVRVLVIDDNCTNRLILKEVLSGWGCTVSEEGDGEAGLARLREAKTSGSPYDLVLLDYLMPRLDGVGVLERMRQDDLMAGTNVIMVSSDTGMTFHSRLRGLGVAARLAKPVRRAELRRAVLATLGREAPSPEGPDRPPVSEATASRPLRILLADDSPDNRLLVLAYLKKYPYTVDSAENGEEAVRLAGSGGYDLILMDVQMPVMDGYEATRVIRKRESSENRERTPIIALTAHALKEDMQKSLDAGCDAHISKPVRKATLLEAIETYARRR